MSLKARAADEVMPLPVFVLAEGAAVTGRVAAAARLAGFSATVPATLTGILLLIDDQDGVLLSFSLRFGEGLLHLGSFRCDHLKSLLLGLRYCLLHFIHGLTLHLIHCLLSFSPDLVRNVS